MEDVKTRGIEKQRGWRNSNTRGELVVFRKLQKSQDQELRGWSGSPAAVRGEFGPVRLLCHCTRRITVYLLSITVGKRKIISNCLVRDARRIELCLVLCGIPSITDCQNTSVRRLNIFRTNIITIEYQK